jgi:hypothetical protein
MMISKLKVLGVVALAGALGLGGARALARHFGAVSADPQPATNAPKTNDQRTAVLRSVDKIDELLDGVERRNRDLQTELQALRKEIVALRSEETKAFGTRASDTTPARNGVEVRSIDRAKKSSDNAKEAGEKLAGQEEGGMDGGTFDQGPAHFRNGQALLIVSPLGDKVALYNTNLGKGLALRLSEVAGTKQTVTPIFSGPIIALSIKGPNVSRVAVAINLGRWYPQDLRVPVENATPIIGNGTVYYFSGRYVYAFGAAGTEPGWDVLELPEGSHARPSVAPDGLTVGHGSHIYLFKNWSHKWTDIDTNAILDAPPVKATEGAKK